MVDWAIALGGVGLLVIVGVVAWCVRGGNGRRILGAVGGSAFGLGSGFVILSASNQSGIASIAGFGLSILLGMIVLGPGDLGRIFAAQPSYSLRHGGDDARRSGGSEPAAGRSSARLAQLREDLCGEPLELGRVVHPANAEQDVLRAGLAQRAEALHDLVRRLAVGVH